ncbi:conserved hypothetical protein [Histoplasma capsulatum var. duboisii H88]|uniref:Uncharacterized protein n=1 Tax=Ajellomyces capsulatus (strain H88) TaxID=544711 RepID=F0ULK7_AJEC8|nr:conserved hypothetical protein [Histoplasma capsulatum var. duboisii H88]
MKLLLSLVIFAGITTTGHLEIGTATIEPRLDKYGWFEGQAREGLKLESLGSWVAGCSAWSLEGRWETWINQIPLAGSCSDADEVTPNEAMTLTDFIQIEDVHGDSELCKRATAMIFPSPRKIVAVTSQTSRAFVEATRLHDLVCSYDDIKIEAAPDVIASTLDAGTKVVVCNFGAQGSSFRTLVMALKPLARTILPIGIGSEPKLGTPEQMRQNMAENIALGMVQVNASDIFEEAVKKMQQGMGAVAEGWDALCSGGPGPETGLVFKLD